MTMKIIVTRKIIYASKNVNNSDENKITFIIMVITNSEDDNDGVRCGPYSI